MSAEYPVPEKIPGLEERAVGATTRKTCIHCHMVREFALRAKWEAGKLSPADLWVYPLPQRIGLTLDVEDGLLVADVAAASPAAKAGIETGDELVSLNGQPLISTADVQWVLHNLPNDAALKVELRREDKLLEKEIKLAGDWKVADIAWRASSWYGLRYGLKLDAAPVAIRRDANLAESQMALVVGGMYGKGVPKLQAAGLKKGDVIVAMDGKTEAITESQFLARLRLDHAPGDSVKLTVLRGDERKELVVPLW